MVMSVLLSFIYPPPSLFVTAMSVVSFASLANAGFMEVRGKHLQYSKFWNVGSSATRSSTATAGGGYANTKLSSRTGMLILYTPAFLAGVASFGLFPDEGFRFLLVRSALSVHFFKRIFEVLFVHKFSGWMEVEAAIIISTSYFLSATTMIYTQHLTKGFPEPPVDLKSAGILIFLIGISGNFYHHHLLSKLREKGDKKYKIPQGGLFNLVICPHYLFEILGFIGVSCMSQTLYAWSFTLGTIIYLIGRSYVTKKWYLSKFEDFPKNVKALIPFIF